MWTLASTSPCGPSWPVMGIPLPLFSAMKTTERRSTLQSSLSRHQSSRAWRCRGVSGSQARDTRDLSPAASRQFPTVLGDTIYATCARISSLDVVKAATTARTMTCICTTRPSRTWSAGVAMFHRLKAATHHRHIVSNMCSNPSICSFSFPQAYNATPVKWLKLFGVRTRRRGKL